MAKFENFEKVTKKQLGAILGVSYPTALKEYQTIKDCLQIKRPYLVIDDLVKFGLFSVKESKN